MKKPVEELERLRRGETLYSYEHRAILDYLDSIRDDAHVCEWP